MAATVADTGARPLEAGTIIRSAFSVYFRRLHVFVLLAALPTLILQLIAAEAFTPLLEFATTVLGHLAPGRDPAQISREAVSAVMGLSGTLTFWMSIGFTIPVALDAKARQRLRIPLYFRLGIARTLPIVSIALLVTLVTTLVKTAVALSGAHAFGGAPPAALVYLINAVSLGLGLWIGSMMSVLAPAAVIEGTGIGSIRRSIDLTKGYRWPIIGVLAVLGLATLIILMIALSILSLAALPIVERIVEPEQRLGTLLWVLTGPIVPSICITVCVGLPHTGFALIYARLREIKEGVALESLVPIGD